MSEEVLSKVMFWVGALFALTPIVLVSAVLAISWHLRRKRRKSGDAAVPS